MTVTYQEPSLIDEMAFRLTWSSNETQPVPFRVYREGVQIAAFNSADGLGEIVLTVAPGESPFVEVLDKTGSVPSIAFPGRLTIHWQAVSGASSYLVQEYISAAWTTQQTVLDNGEGSFTWLSRWLDDLSTNQFRVIPVDSAGNQGSALTFSCVMVRHPDAPEVEYEYNGSGTPTVTVAAA
jgi:hypothetical protein